MVSGYLRKIFHSFFINVFINDVSGKENLPKKGRFIIASNHTSNLDPLLIMAIIEKMTGNRVHYIAKDTYNPLFLFFYWIYGAFKLGGPQEKLMGQINTALQQGKIIGIFPEGSRSFDNVLQKGKTGAVRLATKNNVPILPLVIKGTFELWPRTKLLPKTGKSIHIIIGKPFRTNPSSKSRQMDKRELAHLTDKLMKKIGVLYSKEYYLRSFQKS